jgi:hypothetical protein
MSKQYLIMPINGKKYITVVGPFETLNDLLQHLLSAPIVSVPIFGGKTCLVSMHAISLVTGPNDPSIMEQTYC